MSSSDDSTAAERAMHLPPLSSPRSRREVLRVVDAYAHFWGQPKFAAGLAAPPFAPGDVADLLHRAAAIVVHIRRHLDGEDSEPRMRVAEGSAHEFLWSLAYDPRQQPDRFVRELVHATFKDAVGYVEDLTEACVDEYIAEIEARGPGNAASGARSPLQPVKSLAQSLLQQLSELEDHPEVPADAARWQSVCSALEAALGYLHDIANGLPPAAPSAPALAVAAPATPHPARLGRRKARRLLKRKRRESEGEAPPVEPAHNPADGATPQEEKPARAPMEQDKATGDATTNGKATPSEASPMSETFQITIGKLHEDVARRREDVKGLLEASQALPDDPTLSRQLLEKLQKRCLESSEYLMRDMLTLDSLVASTPEEKARRKEQVDAIQSILDSLDTMTEKLRRLARELRDKEAEVQRDREAALAKAREEAEQRARATSDAQQTNDAEVFERKQQEWANQQSQVATVRKQSAEKLEERLEHIAGLLLRDDAWKTLKLRPRFEVTEQEAAYVLKAYIPDMRRQDVLVDLAQDGAEVVLRGARVPTRPQTVEMLQQLVRAIREGRMDVEQLLRLTDEQLLLQMGSGRYGTFVERFALPDDADREGIQAEYDRGVLQVLIPKQALSFERLFPTPSPRPPFGALWPPYRAPGLPRPRPPSPGFDALFW